MVQFKSWVGSATAALIMFASANASAVEVELKNDGFEDGGQATCQGGFGIGDEAAVSFTHDDAYQLLRVQFLFCGAATMETVTVRVYRETGGTVPGAMIFEADYQIQGAMDAMSQIDLSGENLTFAAGESFRFSLLLQHGGAPGLANDTDGTTTPGTSWIYDAPSSSWSEASALGVNGDWIVRATVDAEAGGAGGSAPTATTTTTSGMMSGGGGGLGGGGSSPSDGEEEDSCGCRVVGAPAAPSPNLAWFGLGAVGLLARRRRR